MRVSGWLKAGQAVQIQNRHFEYFSQWAEQAEPELRGPRNLELLNLLDAELDNLRAALDWGLTRGDYHEATLRLAAALFAFWLQRGHVSEGRGWLVRALASQNAPSAGAIRAQALYTAAYLASFQGDIIMARTLVEASADLWRPLGPAGKKGLTLALARLGELVRRLGDPALARSLASEAVGLAREESDQWGLAYSLAMLGLAFRDQDDYASARSVINESVLLWRGLGDLWGLRLSTECLGDVALRQGNYQLAASHYADQLAMARQVGDDENVAGALEGIGMATINLGQRGQAKLFLEESFKLARASGNKTRLAIALYYFGYLALFEDDIKQAKIFFEQELALARTTFPRWLRAQALNCLAGE